MLSLFELDKRLCAAVTPSLVIRGRPEPVQLSVQITKYSSSSYVGRALVCAYD